MAVFAQKQVVLDSYSSQLRVQTVGDQLSLTLYDTRTGSPLGGILVPYEEWREFVRRIPQELR